MFPLKNLAHKGFKLLCLPGANELIFLAGLHGVINNAGLNHLGEAECTPMSQYEKVTQVNLLGMVRVTKATLPLIRKHQGKCINISLIAMIYLSIS